MSIATAALLERRTVYISDSVRVPVDSSALIQNVFESAANNDWFRSSALSDGTPAAVLHSVLTFCYATGVFSSNDIEAAALHDPLVRYLCANHRPSWQTIREFRRRNSATLKLSLARLFALTIHGSFRFVSSYHLAGDRALANAIRADSYALDF